MSQKVIILFTEGDHDAAFIYRMLKANGFTKYSKAIKDFPKPLDQLLASDVLNTSVPDESLQNARTRFLPSNVVTVDDNLLLIYSLQGESRGDKRIKLIEALNSLNTKDPNEIQAMAGVTLAALYFLDSDDKGIAARLKEINLELQAIFSEVQFEPITSNGSIQTIDDVIVGAYIFVEDGSEYGKLEDVLLPIMEIGNEDIFDKARQFLSIHESTSLFKGRIEYNVDASIKKVHGEKYHPKKSLIGTIGQLQKSGKSNTVCISDASYLNDAKLGESLVCKNIIAFIKSAMA